jgi:hypothetical protein
MSKYITTNKNANETQVYTEEHLIDMVKLRMDEVDQSVKPIVDVGIIDNKPITDIIGGLLNESRLDVLKMALTDKLPKSKKDVSLNSNSNRFQLPEDSLRIISVGANDWRRDVTTFSTTDSREYKRQQYEYTKSTVKNPVVVFIDGTTFEVFPTPSSSKVEIVLISSLTKYEDFTESMINAICWGCVGKTFLVMGMPDNASKAFEIYASIIK